MTQTTATNMGGRDRVARAVRKGLEWTADVGQRRVQPGLRATFSSLRNAAQSSTPLSQQAWSALTGLGRHKGGAPASGVDAARAELEAARRHAERSLTQLSDVDRAAQAISDSLASIEDAFETVIDATDVGSADARRSAELLRRHCRELEQERDTILTLHQRHKGRVAELEEAAANAAQEAAREESRSDQPPRRAGAEILERLSRAGYRLTEWLDEVTATIERRLPFLRRRAERPETASSPPA